MLEQNMTLECNGKVLATKVYIPEGVREEHKGAYGFKFTKENAMMWVFLQEGRKLFDMLWMNHKIGYIALDEDKIVTDVGVLKPWISLKAPLCMYWVEISPDKVDGIKKGDAVTWTMPT